MSRMRDVHRGFHRVNAINRDTAGLHVHVRKGSGRYARNRRLHNRDTQHPAESRNERNEITRRPPPAVRFKERGGTAFV